MRLVCNEKHSTIGCYQFFDKTIAMELVDKKMNYLTYCINMKPNKTHTIMNTEQYAYRLVLKCRNESDYFYECVNTYHRGYLYVNTKQQAKKNNTKICKNWYG
jgi:hypothetical protein